MTVYTVQSTSWNFPPLVWFHSPIKLTTSVNLIEMRCLLYLCFIIFCCLGDTLTSNNNLQGRIQDFKLGGGAHLKKLRWAEGGAKFFGVFRVKNHDFTPKNHIFSNCGRRREFFLGYFVWKITILRQKI
jgi:hypothetical protein